jgi:peptidoglycan-N-acetylglucosamine deacetylase
MVFLLPALLVFLLLSYFLFFSSTSQLFGAVKYQGQSGEKKLIALTFDDGPNEPYTSQILETLRNQGVKATFFLVGENAARYPEITQKIFAEGHIIGNHAYCHRFLAAIFHPSFKDEITKTQDLILQLVGKKPALFRPPWFFRQPLMLKAVNKLGLTTITGTFGSYWEVFQLSHEGIADQALKRIKSGTILVFHDGYNNRGASREKTVEAVKIVIPKLLAAGYHFVTVPQLLDIKSYQ